MSAPDVVIPVRFGERNEELRYALRSLANVPHGRVWLAGYCPTWAQGVGSIPTSQTRTKHENSLKNLLAACRHPAVSEEFYLWNDDFFLLEPLPGGVPAMHRGPISEMLDEYARVDSRYTRGLRATADILARLGVGEPLSYELHVPMLMCKDHVLLHHLEATAAGMPRTTALQPRSLHGNLCDVGGRRVRDVKVWGEPDELWGVEVPFVSTVDHLWGSHPASLEVMELFPEPGPYEKERSKL